jgi:hypothetical protein
MPIGAFPDKQHLPSLEEIQASLGLQWDTWQQLSQFVSDTYQSTGEFKFYGKNYGWAVRYRKNGKALLSIYPAQSSFTVQIILSEAEIAQAQRSDLTQSTLDAIAAANPYPEGRWLFIPVKSAQDLKDVQNMLAIKAPPPLRKAVKNKSTQEIFF